jgi:hypothetical protein
VKVKLKVKVALLADTVSFLARYRPYTNNSSHLTSFSANTFLAQEVIHTKLNMARIRIEFRTPQHMRPYYGQQLGTWDPGVTMCITYACCDHTVEVPLRRPYYIYDIKRALVRVRCACDAGVRLVQRQVDGELEGEEDILVFTSLQEEQPLPAPVPITQTTRQSPYPSGNELAGDDSTALKLLELLRALCIFYLFCGLVLAVLSYAVPWLICNVAPMVWGGSMPGACFDLTTLGSFLLTCYFVPELLVLLFVAFMSLVFLYMGLLRVGFMVGSLVAMTGNSVAMVGSLFTMAGNLVVMGGKMYARAGDGVIAAVEARWV